MAMINITTEAIERVRDAIEPTLDRFEQEGHGREDEGLELLGEFCNFLLAGKSDNDSVDRFLTGQDLVVPA